MKFNRLRAITLAAAVVTLTLLAMPRAIAAECDRACLAGFITKYLDALIAHDPARLPVRADVRFTENGVASITRVQGVFLNANVYKAGTGWDKK